MNWYQTDKLSDKELDALADEILRKSNIEENDVFDINDL